MLALAYTIRYPERVNNLILLSCGPIDVPTEKASMNNSWWNTYTCERDSIKFWGTAEQKEKDPAKAGLMQMVFSLLNRFYDHQLGRKIFPGWLGGMDMNNKMAGLMIKDIYKNYDFVNGLEAYKGKCSIIRGRQDVMPEEVVFKIKEALPQAKIYFIEKCGHMVDLEKPKELFTLLKVVLK